MKERTNSEVGDGVGRKLGSEVFERSLVLSPHLGSGKIGTVGGGRRSVSAAKEEKFRGGREDARVSQCLESDVEGKSREEDNSQGQLQGQISSSRVVDLEDRDGGVCKSRRQERSEESSDENRKKRGRRDRKNEQSTMLGFPTSVMLKSERKGL